MGSANLHVDFALQVISQAAVEMLALFSTSIWNFYPAELSPCRICLGIPIGAIDISLVLVDAEGFNPVEYAIHSLLYADIVCDEAWFREFRVHRTETVESSEVSADGDPGFVVRVWNTALVTKGSYKVDYTV